MKIKNLLHHICLTVLSLTVITLIGCREDEMTVPAEYEILPESFSPTSSVKGFYLVNEGNMGANKCTLDYFDYPTALYARNFYAEKNPGVVKELGDVGNDAGVYGSKLYVVVNSSHKVEVLDAYSGVRIGQVDIPNCRYVRFYEGKAYVSSYVGPVRLDPDAPKGAVMEIDTATLQITRRVTVGYQPEEMEFADGLMYVANSGGYRAPDYDNTLSVVEMAGFRQIRQIPVGPNLHRVRKDAAGRLWVAGRGDRKSSPSCLYVLEKNSHGKMEVTDILPYPSGNLAIHGNLLYFISSDWNDQTQSNSVGYGVIDISTRKLLKSNFITDGTEKEIRMPYALAVHPETGEIFVSDAKNYVSSGTLYCFSPDGKKKWSVRTGDIPASIAFLPSKRTP